MAGTPEPIAPLDTMPGTAPDAALSAVRNSPSAGRYLSVDYRPALCLVTGNMALTNQLLQSAVPGGRIRWVPASLDAGGFPTLAASVPVGRNVTPGWLYAQPLPV